jgi:hypothetical protein
MTDNPELNEWLLEIHRQIFSLNPGDSGILDADNISPDFGLSASADETITGNWTISGTMAFSTHPTGLDHTQIANIGTNTHVTIDTHIADSTLHFAEGSIDHGNITGLGDDDHTQYALLAGRASPETLVINTIDIQNSNAVCNNNEVVCNNNEVVYN